MAKAILVMEMPENCMKCPMGNMNLHDMSKSGVYCQLNKRADITWESANKTRQGWCPLVPMPEMANHPDCCDNGRYDEGWDACLDAIERG